MKKEEKRGNNPEAGAAPVPYRLRLPGFITEEEIGLGDAIQRVTSAVGIKPCGGCRRRAAALNRWMVLSGRRST